MKCPLEITEQFSEWSNTCQDCSHYQECIRKEYDNDLQDPKDPNKNYNIYQCPECSYTVEIAEEDDRIDAGHKCPICKRKLRVKQIRGVEQPTGDNFPTFGVIHNKLSLNRGRTNMIKKLLNADTPKITKDDIIDIGIDIELYNKQCRKEKIKRQYKKKEKQNE